MTYGQTLLQLREDKGKAPKKVSEHALQTSMVEWFAWTHPRLRLHLFAVPNGGLRHKHTATKLKHEGLVSGVPDLCLLRANKPPLFIEVKTKVGKLSQSQQALHDVWVSGDLAEIAVVRSLDEFISLIREHVAT